MNIVKKSELYEEIKIEKISFWSNETTSSPGFFSSFKSFADLRNQLQCPFVMPLVCLNAALYHLFSSAASFGITVVRICTLDFRNAGEALRDGIINLGYGIYFGISAVIDTIHSLFALAMRSLATFFRGLVVVFNAVGDLLRPTVEAVTDETMSQLPTLRASS